MCKIKCHISDGHFLVKKGLKHILSKYDHIELLNDSSDVKEMKSLINEKIPDVLIVDHKTIGLNDLCELELILKEYSNMYVLDISDVYTELEIKAVLNIGIKGMLLKECDEEEIIQAIEASVKDERFFCGTILDILSGDESRIPFSCEPVSLSSRELEIIQLIAKGLTSKEMSEKLFISYHTINTHRKNILKKLDVKGTPELITYAYAMGVV